MKSSPFVEHIISEIQKHTGLPVVLRHITPEYGGSINESFKLETSAGYFFLKRNDREKFPSMFQKEAKGLQLIAQKDKIKVPEFIAEGCFENYQFIILRFIEKGISSKTFWEDFGHSMAKLHQETQNEFGLDEDNYIGSIHQSNSKNNDWTNFFIHQRLQPLVSLALTHKKLNHAHYDQFQKLYERLKNIFPNEKPALLHGDFWNGNFMPDVDGHPVIFDPAVYYGHREMDIAMSKMFGGFHEKFYAAYNEINPLAEGWEKRVSLANLYPLLVHVNLFGGSYVGEVEQILKSY